LRSFGAITWISETHGVLPDRPHAARGFLGTSFTRSLLPGRHFTQSHLDRPVEYLDWKVKGGVPTCPKGHVLPPDFDRRDTLVVGLVGERASSKSHYLASLVKQLTEEGPLTEFGLTVDISPESEGFFSQEYYDPVFRDHSVLGFTYGLQYDPDQESPDDTRRPVVLELQNFRTGIYTNLVMFDSAGEQLYTDVDQARYSGFLMAADIVMLFVVPNTLRELNRHIEPGSDMVQNVRTTKSMFSQLAKQLRYARGLDASDPLDGVVGTVLLAKADLLRSSPQMRRDLLQEPYYRGASVDSVLHRIEEESDWIARLIEDSGGRDLVAGLQARYPGCTYHTVSATGEAAIDSHFTSVAPFRCLDPLLYGLIKLGVIEKDAW
jgi:hypothetical protein